jgi:hypothetical protein
MPACILAGASANSPPTPGLNLAVGESGGDNLSASYTRDLADRFNFTIDVDYGMRRPARAASASASVRIGEFDLAPQRRIACSAHQKFNLHV